jgi:type VI secretion system FHA domain protein
LLRLSVEGLVGLLQARATVKQEVRAAMTVIGSQANNPLKFSPNAQAALRQLLSGQTLPGFLGPEQALRDASEDLIAHQVATMAGMRAAIDALLSRFDPAGLQARLGDASLLDAVLPLHRKGKLWESFTQLYAEISDEARQDFEKVFGEAFVAAYEAQIDALRRRLRP